MCFVCGLLNGVYQDRADRSATFFEYGSLGGTAAKTGIITFWTCVILFQNLVPISLWISIEIVKTLQVFFIWSDVDLYYEKLDYPCTPKSWNISDDLGQIEYIFSDKTGTLTQNVMEFRKCTINGVSYGEAFTEAMLGMQKRIGQNAEDEAEKAFAHINADRIQMLQELEQICLNSYMDEETLTFVSSEFMRDMRSGDRMEVNKEFMRALALCHSVLTEEVSKSPRRIEYKAQSPDEASLVATARDVGFALIERNSHGVVLDELGDVKEYEVLNTLEFNSSRKRMSAIIRRPGEDFATLYCKGADNVIYSRLKAGEQTSLRHKTSEDLDQFSNEGLRTLCIAKKTMTMHEYNRWNSTYEVAAAAIENREERLEEVSDAIERELTLLGGTAIEDRLQEGVPDSIQLLADAGIKLWVLTGDRVETAINIGFSCNLLNNDMKLLIFRVGHDAKLEDVETQLHDFLQTNFSLSGSSDELKAASKNHDPPAPTHALIIDGDTLHFVLKDELQSKFLLLCKQCKSVICCRVSPSQKALVVRMVKRGLDVMTLSIGDGANDVAMIQEADVGVGIVGEEGRQAAMSADYAIGQFRFLGKLVVVHGRWSYRRICNMISNFFYKVNSFSFEGLSNLQNLVWTFTLFWYQIYDSFDGSYLFDYTYARILLLICLTA